MGTPVSRLREARKPVCRFARCFGGRRQVGKDHAQKSMFPKSGLKQKPDGRFNLKPFRFKEAPLRPENHLFQCGRSNFDARCRP
jgi:hypothetical protein